MYNTRRARHLAGPLTPASGPAALPNPFRESGRGEQGELSHEPLNPPGEVGPFYSLFQSKERIGGLGTRPAARGLGWPGIGARRGAAGLESISV